MNSKYRINLSCLVGILLIFAPIPLGLRTEQLSLLALMGIIWLVLSGKVSISGCLYPLFFLIVTVLASLISVARGYELSYFQFFRGCIFPLMLLFIVRTKLSNDLLVSIEKAIPVITFGAILSAVFYFLFASDLYNSTLDIPYEDAVYKRLFVYPTYFFLLLFCDAAINNRQSQITYLLLLSASGSKAIFLCITLVYLYIIFSKYSFKKRIWAALLIAFGVIVAGYVGLFERIDDFIRDGDPWRVNEPMAALEKLMDPVRFFIGNGSGITYWEGRNVFIGSLDEESRAIINTQYDVHNGFLAIALKFGFPLMILYMLLLIKLSLKAKAGFLIAMILMLNIYLSHGPVQVVESIGLAIGLRLLEFRNANQNT